MEARLIGVYVRNCGTNIAKVVNCDEVVRAAQDMPGVVVARAYKYMCSTPDQEMIQQDIAALGLDRVVVSACSPRMHERTLRRALQNAGINPYFLEMANIRECSCTSVSATQEDRLAADWQQAIASTRRMQSLINQVVSVLHEEEAGRHYEITLAELAAIVSDRVLPLTRERGVQFQTRLEGEAGLPNRTELLALILVNLSQNALEATPSGKTVTLALRHTAGTLECEVSDEGSGFPEALRPHLFKPCQSNKEGGSGIGLALCKQLANHLGASLELRRSAPPGCVFALTLPATLCERTPPTATVTLSG